MELRNFILIALAFDATSQECDAAHELVDRLGGGADPAILVSATVNGTTGAAVTTGSGVPAGSASNPQMDSAGFPWDERIHSSNKQIVGDGTWRARRGVTPALKAAVEAELRKTMDAIVPTAEPLSLSTPVPAGPPLTIAGPPMPGGKVPPMPGATVADPAYTALVQLVAKNTVSTANPDGEFTDQYVKDVLIHYGVAEGSLQNLAHRPDLVSTIDAWFRQVLEQ